MPITGSQLFNHLSSSNEIPYACRFHFHETPLLWYESDEVYLQSQRLYLHGLQIQNPWRLNEEKWNDEYYRMYYDEMFEGSSDPFESVSKLDKFEYRNCGKAAALVLVLQDFHIMEREGHTFRRGSSEPRIDSVKLSVIPTKLVSTEKELYGVRLTTILVNFDVQTVLDVTLR